MTHPASCGSPIAPDLGGTTTRPEFNDRRGGLLAFGIFEILLGVLILLLLFLMMIGAAISLVRHGSASPSGLQTILAAAFCYLLPAACFLAMGIGSIQARRWARTLCLIGAWFWLAGGLMATGFLLLSLPHLYARIEHAATLPAPIMAWMKWVQIGLTTLVAIIMPGAFILFYGSRHTKATCEHWDAATRWTDRCPAPVLAIALLTGLAAPGMLLSGFYGWCVSCCGILFSGPAGAAVVLPVAFFIGYTAWGMYRLRYRAWWCAMALVVIWASSTIATFYRMNWVEFCERMGLTVPQTHLVEHLVVPMAPWLILATGFLLLAAMTYMLYVRRYFVQPPAPTPVSSGVFIPAHRPPLPNHSRLAGYALAIAILAVCVMLLPFGLPFGALAVILGYVSQGRINASGGQMTGWEIAAAARLLGYLSGAVSLAVIIFVLAFALPAGRHAMDLRAMRSPTAEYQSKSAEEIYDAILAQLGAGQQAQAEQVLEALVRENVSDQRLLFLFAVCARSRWSISKSNWAFERVRELDPATVEGNCARYVLEVDAKRNVQKNLNALFLMTQNNPDNPLLLWVLGSLCRDYYRHTWETTYSRVGERCFRELLERFQFGPVKVHHTFANVLRELDLNEEALEHHRIAVKMEPEAWTYIELAGTLSELRRHDEADRVYARVVQLAPDYPRYWREWADNLRDAGRYEESIAKTRRAIDLESTNFTDYLRLGRCLAKLEKYEEALAAFELSIQVNPAQRNAYEEAAIILKKLGRPDEVFPHYQKAFEWARQEAERGDRDSEFALGLYYFRGMGVDRDHVRAVAWYRKAAERGDARAQYNLGRCYANGEGVAADPVQAFEWYRKSAEQGYRSAQNTLGLCYERGRGVAKDVRQAIDWYNRAAEGGNAAALYNLGRMYYFGKSVPKDLPLAVKYWQQSAELGYTWAQNNLGCCYYDGSGTATNYAQAFFWWQKAADMGEVESICGIGKCYYFGHGVQKNIPKAREFLQQAAQKGSKEAKKLLEEIHVQKNEKRREKDGQAHQDM